MAKKKTLAKLKQEAQKVFNAYIRKRDEGKPCISCGQLKPLQAGHYYPVSTHDGLRYEEDNVHGECAYCNCFNEGHLIGYTHKLYNKIGQERFDRINRLASEYKKKGYKFSRSELEELIKEYKLKLKEL